MHPHIRYKEGKIFSISGRPVNAFLLLLLVRFSHVLMCQDTLARLPCLSATRLDRLTGGKYDFPYSIDFLLRTFPFFSFLFGNEVANLCSRANLILNIPQAVSRHAMSATNDVFMTKEMPVLTLGGGLKRGPGPKEKVNLE